MTDVIHHDVRFPGESPDYRNARDELLRAEVELRRQTEAVAAQRRRLPLGGRVPTDYVFEEGSVDSDTTAPVALSELFEDGKDVLFLYNFMYGPAMETPCPMCTSFIDALDGEVRHLNQRINLAIVARNPIERLRAHARRRGWRDVRLLSSAGNTFNRDYLGEDEQGDQRPIGHVFVRTSDGVRHAYSTELAFTDADAPNQNPRHIDSMWPLWNVFDLTPIGRGDDWFPSLEYTT